VFLVSLSLLKVGVLGCVAIDVPPCWPVLGGIGSGVWVQVFLGGMGHLVWVVSPMWSHQELICEQPLVPSAHSASQN
jgi:hypothetical protein